jgi:hypothetical protein
MRCWVHIVHKVCRYILFAAPVGRTVCGHSLAGIASSNPACGQGCLSLLCVVCCQIRVSAIDWSLVQRSPYRVWCVWVWLWSIDNKKVLAHWVVPCHGKEKSAVSSLSCYHLHLNPKIWEILKRHTQTDLGYCGRQGVEKCLQREFSCFIYRLCISTIDVTNSNVPLPYTKVLKACGGTAPLTFHQSTSRDHKLPSIHWLTEYC